MASLSLSGTNQAVKWCGWISDGKGIKFRWRDGDDRGPMGDEQRSTRQGEDFAQLWIFLHLFTISRSLLVRVSGQTLGIRVKLDRESLDGGCRLK
jgi:hypothetical protein